MNDMTFIFEMVNYILEPFQDVPSSNCNMLFGYTVTKYRISALCLKISACKV